MNEEKPTCTSPRKNGERSIEELLRRREESQKNKTYRGQKIKSIRERLQEKFVLSERGCWEWTGCVDNFGYGVISLYNDGKNAVTIRTHKLSLYLYANIDSKSQCVLHRCDNPKCCNPEHLFLGDRADNCRDMTEKGRHWTEHTPLKTHCKHGHEFTPENTLIARKGDMEYRRCRECSRIDSYARWKTRKEAEAVNLCQPH